MNKQKKPVNVVVNKPLDISKVGFKDTKNYAKTQYAPRFMEWTSRSLPNRQKYFLTDIDLIIRDCRTGVENLMLIEIKCRDASVTGHQRRTLRVINKIIIAGLKALKNVVFGHRIKYHGLHKLSFSKELPDDGGTIRWDHRIVTEQELINILSFSDDRLPKNKNSNSK